MRLVVLTGAGVSAESGLGTFRDVGGAWDKYDLAQVATPEGFARDPDLVLHFYNLRRANMRAARPNPAHIALARLECALHDRMTLVTQNIDDLHERAGSGPVLHMHGELSRATCAACGHRWVAPDTMSAQDPCPSCDARATRPDVVWFGEVPYHLADIGAMLAKADLFVAIGTSGTVYPAAGFVSEAAAHGARTLEINLAPSEVAGAFDECRIGPASTAVPAWVSELLDGPAAGSVDHSNP